MRGEVESGWYARDASGIETLNIREERRRGGTSTGWWRR